MTHWNPIETAPQDEIVIVCAPGWPQSMAAIQCYGRWWPAFGPAMAVQPELWMPLPEPPRKDA